MKKYYAIGIFIAGLVLLGCKKEAIKPTETTLSETPVFKVVGTIDGDPVEFMAGVDGMYLSTYTLDVNGVEKFCGNLTNGENHFKIGVLNGKLGQAQPSPLPLVNTIRFAAGFPSPLIVLSKGMLVNASYIDQVNFRVDGENVGSQLQIMEPGKYEVCADIAFYDGTNKTVCNTLILGYEDLGCYEIKHFGNTEGNVKAWVQADEALSSVSWYIDGAMYSNDEMLDVNFSQGGVHTVMSRVTFANGIVRDHSILVDGDGTARFFDDMFLYKTQINESLFRDFKATADIVINGVHYVHAPQTLNGSISVSDISYYGKNTAGNNVYLIKGSMVAPLVNVQTQQQVNANLSIAFGVERP